MKHRKILFSCLFAVLLLFGTTVLGATLPEPDPDLLYVTDLADVLSSETEKTIAERNDTLYAATGAQFAILTVESLPAGYDSESYCYEVFNAWGIGSAEKNNGLLLLLVPDAGKFWMTSGTGLQGRFSGGMITELLDEYLAEDFDAGRYDEAVLALFEAVWTELEDLYGTIDAGSTAVQPNYTPDYAPDYTPGYDSAAVVESRFDFGAIVFFFIIVTVLVLCIAARPGRRYYTSHTPPPPGNPPYYRTYVPRPRRTFWHTPVPPPMQRPTVYRPSANNRPTGGSFSSRPSGGRSFGGGSTGSRPSGGSRSFGGGRSHGGGGGRR